MSAKDLDNLKKVREILVLRRRHWARTVVADSSAAGISKDMSKLTSMQESIDNVDRMIADEQIQFDTANDDLTNTSEGLLS